MSSKKPPKSMSASFGEDVTIRFVIPEKKTEDEYSEDVKRAFQVCVDHSLNPSWISETDCMSIHPTKTDVFVLENFIGSSFGFLRTFTCIVIGPRCILDCLAADILIPKSKFPLFTLAMRNCFVTTTGFFEPEKTLISEKIQYMGGVYCPEFRQSVTHLIANHICSAKYEKAVEKHIPIMTEKWVDALWEESNKCNVHANDEEFEKYKCTVFHKLVITTSQIHRKEKEGLISSINDNGGEFCGELQTGRTNVLVISKPFGEKFTFAKLWKVPCVTPAWVTDSVAAGHALPYCNYSLQFTQKCSTPEHSVTPNLPDISTSVIHFHSSRVNATITCNTPKTPLKDSTLLPTKNTESPKKNKHLQLIKKIKMSMVRKAGIFLDGCNVYLSGFNPEYSEKLRKIINMGGATRFNEISESVTHVIVGDFVPSDIRIVKSQGARLHVVTVEWLVESIQLHSTAPEDKFSCLDDLPSPIEFQSPLSKKGLLALRSEKNKTVQNQPPPTKPIIPKVLFDQYTSAFNESKVVDAAIPSASADSNPCHTSEFEKDSDGSCAESANVTQTNSITGGTQAEFFSGVTFSIVGYTARQVKVIEKHITSAGGKVVKRLFKGIPDYGVVPLHGVTLFQTTAEIVTHLWLDDCAEEGMVVPVKYYHQPVNFVLDAKPLSGCVVTTTAYNGVELRFITELLEGLGATNQSMMARIHRPAENLLATTHLICPEDIDLIFSRKYKAACKWGIPSVSHMWLLACAKEKKRVDEEPFLVSQDSHDSSVVIAKTPVARSTKRKHTDDTTISNTTNLYNTNAPQFPLTPDQNISGRFSSPLQSNVANTSKQSFGAAYTPGNTPYSTPKSPGDIPTPDTPYGRTFKENPSPKTRKMWKKWIDQWPEEPKYKAPPPKQRRNSTPMAEIIHKCWQKFAHEPYLKNFHRTNAEDGSQIEDADNETGSSQTCCRNEHNPNAGGNQDHNIDVHTSTPPAGINTQLQELNQILDCASKASGEKKMDNDGDNVTSLSSREVARAPESLDLCTDLVEWVDPVISNQQRPPPLFMLTSVDNRDKLEEIIRSLGGCVCSSNSPSFDPTATHLVCEQPTRNEKILSSIAAGKWILEKRFLEDSKKECHFLDEEDYEWGNPRAGYLESLVKPGSINEQLAMSMYRWRCKIQSTGKKAFAGMKAIVCSSIDKTELYQRIIIAGGGEVLNISPPFSEPGNATVCIIELTKIQHRVDLQSLVDKNVPCVLPIYLNNYLIFDPPPDVMDCLIPEYRALQ